MSFTYTTLKQAIQDYTNNTETLFVNNLDRFIQQSEERIFKNVNLPAFKKNVTGTSTAGNEFLSTPSDFMAPFSLAVDNSGLEHLMFRDLPFIRESYPDANTTGVPKYYSLFDEDSMIMAPTPNNDFRFELSYFYRPDSITISSDGADAGVSSTGAVGRGIPGATGGCFAIGLASAGAGIGAGIGNGAG